jgi:hypothetical protein
MARISITLLAWLTGIALVVGSYLLLGVFFPEGLPGLARALTAVLLVNVSIAGLLLLLRTARPNDGGDDDDTGDDGGRGGGGGGEPWPWRWPTGDGGSALRVPDYVPEEWLPKQPLER